MCFRRYCGYCVLYITKLDVSRNCCRVWSEDDRAAFLPKLLGVNFTRGDYRRPVAVIFDSGEHPI